MSRHACAGALAATVLCATLVAGAGPIAIAAPATAAQLVTTANLNVRSGPGMSYPVIGGLRHGASVTVLSSATGWATIRYQGKTAYVSLSYLRAPVSPPVSPPPTPTPRAIKQTTANVNARSGPSLDDSVIRVVPTGTTIQTTEVVENDFAQALLGGKTVWMHVRYLSSTGSSATPGAAPVVSAPQAPALPPVGGTRVVTAPLNVRETPDQCRLPVGFLPQGSTVLVTGVVKGSWTAIIYTGTTRWVASAYLAAPGTAVPVDSTTSPSTALPGITATTRAAYDDVHAAFPEIKTVYGVRPGTGSDHNIGMALDFMIPGYKKDSSVGDRLAEYLVTHADRLHVKYVIWKQQIWIAAHRGWKKMGDRGGDTANHVDHVHLSLTASSDTP